jgi:outer membrane protein TolC
MRDFSLFILLVLAAPAAAAAQTPLPARVTLEDAIARAAANSHRLGELRARQAQAGSVLDQGRAADLPIVSAQAGYQRTNHVDPYGFVQNGRLQVLYPDVPDNWRARLDMQWPIYTGGRAQALERAAAAERDASGKDLEAARADLRLETTRAYWALVTAAESVSVVGESVRRIEGQLADVRARFDAGFLPPRSIGLPSRRSCVSRRRVGWSNCRPCSLRKKPSACNRGRWASPKSGCCGSSPRRWRP